MAGQQVTDPLPTSSMFSIISLNELIILDYLAKKDIDFGYCNFATIGLYSGLDRHVVQDACRSLAAKHLVRFSSRLLNCDDKFLGSGYGATAAGRSYIDSLPSDAARRIERMAK
jgi:hypothetical protein